MRGKPTPTVTWVCPKCSARENQLPQVRGVQHLCPAVKKLVDFIKVIPDEEKK